MNQLHSISAANAGIAAVPVKQIEEWFSRLNGDVNQCVVLAQEIEAKFSPLIRSQPPIPDGKNVSEEPLVEFAERLRDITRVVTIATSVLSSVLNRAEI